MTESRQADEGGATEGSACCFFELLPPDFETDTDREETQAAPVPSDSVPTGRSDVSDGNGAFHCETATIDISLHSHFIRNKCVSSVFGPDRSTE